MQTRLSLASRSGARAARLFGLTLLTLLLVTLGGDRSAQAIVERGIDPLQVLDLYVRPNVIIVLDSSGSMRWPVGSGDTFSGDHPRSRLFQAKAAIRDVVESYQSSVNFQMGTYTQRGSVLQYPDPVRASGHGSYRFQYVAQTQSYPATNDEQMETGELTVMGDLGRSLPTTCTGAAPTACDTIDRGLQSWQIVGPGSNVLRYVEGGVTCNVTVTPTRKFYRVGGPATPQAAGAPAGTLAADLEAAMNGCGGRPGTPNVYRVGYTPNTGVFLIRRQTGANNWAPVWSASSIRGRFGVPGNPAAGAGPFQTVEPYMLLMRRPGAISQGNWGRQYSLVENNIDPDGAGPEPARTVTSHQLFAGAYFNGEVIRVDPNGTVCDVTFPAAPLPVPAKVTLQQVGANCGSDTGTPVDFTFAGGIHSGNSVSCNGFMEGAGLRPCDQSPGNTQLDAIQPVIEREVKVDADGSLASYAENPATLRADTMPAASVGGIKTAGSTPIAASIQDLRTNFGYLWSVGQLACPAGPPQPLPAGSSEWDVRHCPDRDSNGVSDPGYSRPALDAISTHTDPKERTIVLFVTDGDDTCASGDLNTAARYAAYQAQELYRRIDAAEPASSVQTYVLSFGNGASPTRLNWIAWGGSGMVKTSSGGAWTSAPTAGEEAACKAAGLCQDAFIAPDAATLKSYLMGIINQGVTSGEFVAQTPLITSVFEYAASVPPPPPPPPPAPALDPYSPYNPRTRYKAFVPVRLQSSFTLPGFKGKMAAYANDRDAGTCPLTGGCTVQLWDASARLAARLNLSAAVCQTTGVADQCIFRELHGDETDLTIGASSDAAIKRRIYSTRSNGVFPVTNQNRVNLNWMRNQGGTGDRVTLWPPMTNPVAVITGATDYGTQGALDMALGLPVGALTATHFDSLLGRYRACAGTNLPAACTSATAATRAAAARKEAREMMLAYMAGAEWVPDGDGNPTRTPSTASPASARYQIVYKRRSDPLADGTYGSPAVVSQPIGQEPIEYRAEYRLYRDGGKVSGNKVDGVLQGFGLRNADADCQDQPGCDGNNVLKPRMTIVIQPANDMLHAFRVGCSSPAASGFGCSGGEQGGEELWGFVPYDQLAKLGARLAVRPPRRDPHDYMITTAVRFGDVFIPGALATTDGSPSLSSRGLPAVAGLWRQIVIFGRGQGGKHMTALDVTATGPFTASSLGTMAPIVLWNRGNPDTRDGTPTGPKNNTVTAGDFEAYKLMGETWSVPTISYVNRLGTPRKPCNGGAAGDPATGVSAYCSDQVSGGVSTVSFVGSGYGEDGTREGYALFTLDTLTGDIVAYADVEARATAKGGGWPRTGGSYPGYRNAIVADPSAYGPDQLRPGVIRHPAYSRVTRVYVGDLHGRAWKFLAYQPHTAIAFADLGADQPIGVGAAMIQPVRGVYVDQPHIYMIAGNETRADGPFKLFGLYDSNPDDLDPTEPDTTATPVTLFTRTLLPADAGVKTFRGTLPPITFYNSASEARVSFGATRFNKPSDPDAPPVPPYPCRSSFDSLVYGLKADAGTGAYNLPNDGGAAEFIEDTRIMALAVVAHPTTNNATIEPISGQVTDVPPPPVGGTAPDPGGKPPVGADAEAPAALLFRNAASVCGSN